MSARHWSTICPNEFYGGYSSGWLAAAEGQTMRKKSTGMVPSDFSRGFAKGYEDQVNGLNRCMKADPYNEVVEAGRTYQPEEYPVDTETGSVYKWIASYADAARLVELLNGFPIGGPTNSVFCDSMLAQSGNRSWNQKFVPFRVEYDLKGSWFRVSELWTDKPREGAPDIMPEERVA